MPPLASRIGRLLAVVLVLGPLPAMSGPICGAEDDPDQRFSLASIRGRYGSAITAAPGNQHRTQMQQSARALLDEFVAVYGNSSDPETAKFVAEASRALEHPQMTWQSWGARENGFTIWAGDDEYPRQFQCAREQAFGGLTQSQADELRLVSGIRFLLVLGERNSLEAVAKCIDSASESVTNLVENGLPMWPQEVWLYDRTLAKHFRSKPTPIDTGPTCGGEFKTLPLHQPILLRPTAGFALRTEDTSSGSGGAAVALEWYGRVWYADRSFDSWWALSLFSHSSGNTGFGHGVMLRRGKLAFGISRARVDTGEYVTQLFIGVELYDAISETRERLRKTEATLEELGGASRVALTQVPANPP